VTNKLDWRILPGFQSIRRVVRRLAGISCSLVKLNCLGRPPFKPDNGSTEDTNEPYVEWQQFILNQSQADIPLIVSTSYGDDEFTVRELTTFVFLVTNPASQVPESYARRVCAGFAQLGARGVSVFFSSGDGGVGDGETDSSLVWFSFFTQFTRV
jgi:hypothetical protein